MCGNIRGATAAEPNHEPRFRGGCRPTATSPAAAVVLVGQTLAFMVPVVDRLMRLLEDPWRPRDIIDTVIVVPTPELVRKTFSDLQRFTAFTDINCVAVCALSVRAHGPRSGRRVRFGGGGG